MIQKKQAGEFMGPFMIWLIIVIVILLKSVYTNKQEKAKKSKSSAPRTHSKPQKPAEDIFTRAKRNVSEDFSKDKPSVPTEFSQNVPQNMDTKVTKTAATPVADSSEHSAMNSVPPDSTTSEENSEDLMRTLDDLMVKGYEPRLTFERDFVAEGMELLNRYY